MAKKIVKKVFTVLVILVIGLLVAMVFKVKQEQKNSVNAAKERYEQMISGDRIMTLTEDILEEDFQNYVNGVERAKDLLHLYLGFFAAFLGLLILWMLIGAVLNVINRDGLRSIIGHVIAAMLFAGALVGGYTIVKDKILPQVEKEDPASEPHYFAELQLTGVQKDVESIDRDESTETKIYYYLITDTGSRIGVKEEVYDRFGEPGVYYVGRTDQTIFSLYEGKYFKLFGK